MIIYNILYDGQIIFTGSEREVQERFNKSRNTRLCYYTSYGGKLDGIYDVGIASAPPTKAIFNFYENGKWVFKGTSREFKEHFNLDFNGSVSPYARNNSTICGRFKAKRVEDVDFEKKVDYFADKLKFYNEVYSKMNPEIYLEALRERGYNCTYRKYVIKQNMGRKRETDFVIEKI